MSNNASCVPAKIEKESASLSKSVAVTVVTAVAFSATLIAAVAAPPFEVITGALSSATLVI